MQLRNSYQSTNKKTRAKQLRRDAMEMKRAGFDDSAQQNLEMAEYLDPTPREEMQNDYQGAGRNAAVRGGTRSNRQNTRGEGYQVSRGSGANPRMAASRAPNR